MSARNLQTLGTLLRHLSEILDGAVEQAYVRAGLDYRPRWTPIVRALIDLGPTSIRAISRRAGITHSAVSQTVSQMAKEGLVRLGTGGDARERIVTLTPKAAAMLPALHRHWAAVNTAAQGLDMELSTPLSDLLREAIEVLERRPFAGRIDQAVAKQDDARTRKVQARSKTRANRSIRKKVRSS